MIFSPVIFLITARWIQFFPRDTRNGTCSQLCSHNEIDIFQSASCFPQSFQNTGTLARDADPDSIRLI